MLKSLSGSLLLATATAIAQPAPDPSPAASAPGAAVQKHRRPGRDGFVVLDCLEIRPELQQLSPGPIAIATLDCVQRGRYDEAARLFLLAGVDARFDDARDGGPAGVDSARRLTSLLSEALPPDRMAELARATHALLNSDVARRSLCETIRPFGPPTDLPPYLTPSEAAAQASARHFDADREWPKIVQTGLDCPA